MSPNNSPKICILRPEKVMKRETKIYQTYFLSETNTSKRMKSNDLKKERIVWKCLIHFEQHLGCSFWGVYFPKMGFIWLLQIFDSDFFGSNPMQTWSSSCQGRSHSVLGGDERNGCFSLDAFSSTEKAQKGQGNPTIHCRLEAEAMNCWEE